MLLTLLVVVTIAIVRMRNLFGVIVLSGAYSFLMASVLMVDDAVDVAMTEAAVGAGVSTVLLLAALHLTKAQEYPRPRPAAIPLLVAVGLGAALIWATYDPLLQGIIELEHLVSDWKRWKNPEAA
jgi:multicomponent Na+:H+ antiporter subunit B